MATISDRLAQRTGVSPLRRTVGNALITLGSGQVPNQDADLERLIKYNQLQTGSPEFELQKAQTLANIGVSKDLMVDRLKKEQEQKMYQDAMAKSGQAPPAVGNTPPSGGNTPAFLTGQPPLPPMSGNVPSFLQGVGQSPNSPQGDYEAVNKPPVNEYNPQVGAMISKPQPAEMKPTLAREAANAAAKERGQQSGQVDPLIGTATGAMRGGVARYKAMIAANGGNSGRIGGVGNYVGGLTGANPNVRPYEGLKIEIATELAKIANPSGRGAQATIDQFAKLLPDDFSNTNEASNKIHDAMLNAFSRYHSYKFGVPPTQADLQNYEGQIQDILNTPAAKQANMGQVNQGGGMPSFNSEQEAHASGYKGKAKIAGRMAVIE